MNMSENVKDDKTETTKVKSSAANLAAVDSLEKMPQSAPTFVTEDDPRVLDVSRKEGMAQTFQLSRQLNQQDEILNN